MGQKITVTESQLRDMVVNAINEAMEEGERIDAWKQKGKNFVNNMRAGVGAGINGGIDYHADPNAKDALSQGISNIGQRFGNFKKGYNMQKQYKRMEDLKQELKQLVNNKLISPKDTVGKLIDPNAGLGGFGAARAKLQRQYQNLNKNGRLKKLEETIDKVLNEFLNEQNKKEVF